MLCRCVPALFPINDMKAPGRSGAGGKRNHRERVGILPDELRAFADGAEDGRRQLTLYNAANPSLSMNAKAKSVPSTTRNSTSTEFMGAVQ